MLQFQEYSGWYTFYNKKTNLAIFLVIELAQIEFDSFHLIREFKSRLIIAIYRNVYRFPISIDWSSIERKSISKGYKNIMIL